MVRRCLENKAPRYLLHSGHRRHTPVDIDDQPTCTAWSFRSIDVAHSAGLLCQSVGGPTVWNSLPVELRKLHKQRCLLAHIEDDLVCKILVHWAHQDALHETALYKFILILTSTLALNSYYSFLHFHWTLLQMSKDLKSRNWKKFNVH